MEHMLMITDLMLDTVLHLPHMIPLHQHMVPQLLAMILQLPHMSSQLTPMESLMEVMKKRPCPTSPINVGILVLVGLSLLVNLAPGLVAGGKRKRHADGKLRIIPQHVPMLLLPIIYNGASILHNTANFQTE